MCCYFLPREGCIYLDKLVMLREAELCYVILWIRING